MDTLAFPIFRFNTKAAMININSKTMLILNFKSQIVCTNITKNLSTYRCKMIYKQRSLKLINFVL